MGSLLENGWLRKTLHLDMDCQAKKVYNITTQQINNNPRYGQLKKTYWSHYCGLPMKY